MFYILQFHFLRPQQSFLPFPQHYGDSMVELEYYLGINPQTLTDDEWAEKFAQLQNIREEEAKTNGFSG